MRLVRRHLGAFYILLAGTAALLLPILPNLARNASGNAVDSALAFIASGPGARGSIDASDSTGPKSYTVIPVDSNSMAYIQNEVYKAAVKDSVRAVTARNRAKFGYILYWSFQATDEAAQRLGDELGHLASLSSNEAAYEQVGLQQSQVDFGSNATNEPEMPPVNANAKQRDAAEDLRVVSWPPGKTLANVKDYTYSVDWRASPTIYIIDTGIDTTSPDFKFGIDRWLYSDAVKMQRRNTPTDDNPLSHGSCVLSKAIGDRNGVYKNLIGRKDKNSKIVVFKMNTVISIGQVFEAFNAILAEIQDSDGTQSAVVMFPYSARASAANPQHAEIRTKIEEIFDLGGVVVVPSGNHALDQGRQDVDGLPALWEGPSFPLIVVGAVDDTGAKVPVSQGPTHVTVWAPGAAVRCAKRYGYWTPTGTSASTGTVAGLAAYILALKQVDFVSSNITPINVKNWIQTQASWIRQPSSGLRVIWNREQG